MDSLAVRNNQPLNRYDWSPLLTFIWRPVAFERPDCTSASMGVKDKKCRPRVRVGNDKQDKDLKKAARANSSWSVCQPRVEKLSPAPS